MRWMKAARVWSLALILALLTFMVLTADLGKVAGALTGIRWGWALWIPVLNLVNTLVEALRLSVILFPFHKQFHLRNAFSSALVAILGNVMLPLRFGDGARAYYIAKSEKIGLSSAASALMFDRIADFLAFFTLMAITAVFHPFPASVTRMGLVAGAIFAGAVGIILVVAGVGHKLGGENPTGKVRRRLGKEVSNFMAGLSAMRNAGLLFPILCFSALSWLLRAAMIWFMFQVFGLELPLMATPVTLILLNFGIAIVSTPANLGGFELAMVGALKLFSVEIELALSYALALHVLEVAPIFVFGSIYLWLEGFKTRDVLKSAMDTQDPPG